MRGMDPMALLDNTDWLRCVIKLEALGFRMLHAFPQVERKPVRSLYACATSQPSMSSSCFLPRSVSATIYGTIHRPRNHLCHPRNHLC
jgi:hypothetical protein